MSKTDERMGDLNAMLRALQPLGVSQTKPGARDAMNAIDAMARTDDEVRRNRQLVADFCRLVGARVGRVDPAATADLPPRVRQTLSLLLDGASEKQIARELRLSQHTVHVYVKQIYKHYNVCSRAELLARWVKGNPAAMPSGTPAAAAGASAAATAAAVTHVAAAPSH